MTEIASKNPFLVKAPAVGSADIEPGNYPAVLVALVDLGTHKDDYKDKASLVRKAFLVWELTGERMPGSDFNHVIGRDYNLTFGSKSNLRSLIKKWRGSDFKENEEFDLTRLVGKPCLLSIVSKASQQGNRSYAVVEGAAQLPKGMMAPAPKRQPFNWCVDQGGYPDAEWLPYIYGKPVTDWIDDCQERKGKGGPSPGAAVAIQNEPSQTDATSWGDDTIPF